MSGAKFLLIGCLIFIGILIGVAQRASAYHISRWYSHDVPFSIAPHSHFLFREPRTRVGLGLSFTFDLRDRYYDHYHNDYHNHDYPSPSRKFRAPATLRIEVDPPEAEIFVDGKFIGRGDEFQGPAEISILPGRHRVEFRLGEASAMTEIQVTSGARAVVRQHLPAPLPPPTSSPQHDEQKGVVGMLKLDVIPIDSSIHIDGTFMGMADQSDDGKIALPVGSHHVRILKPGYRPFTTNILIEANTETELNVKLDRKP